MKHRSTNPKPTIKDVALACGVSEATVSYVINGKRVLKADTREKVARAIQEMNYHPSAVARGLSSKKLRTIGVVLGAVNPVDCVVNTYASALLQGVVTEAQRNDFNVTLFTAMWQNAQVSLSQYRDGRTDGVIVMGPTTLNSDILESLWRFNVSTVAISAETTAPIPTVDVDNYAGVVMAVSHLMELGHRRIAYLTGNDDLASFKPRLLAFTDAVRNGMGDQRPELIQISDFNGSLAADQIHTLMGLPQPPTAVFASNDHIAFEVIKTARSMGLSVPRDLSVVGFDDVPASILVTPALTTIRQPLVDIGITATRLLMETQAGDGKASTTLLAPELIVRGTTAPPEER